MDDVDVCFLNGKEVGRTGRLPEGEGEWESAWNVPRRYRAPASLVRWGRRNVLALKVYNHTGLGGILREPVLGLALPGPDVQWEVTRRQAGPAPDEPEPSLEPLGFWLRPDLPAPNSLQEHRLRFGFEPELPGGELLLDLGPLPGPGETYLNGKLIGRTGSLPDRGESDAQGAGRGNGDTSRGPAENPVALAARNRRVYLVPPGLLRRGRTNELRIRTCSYLGARSLPGIPMLRLAPAGVGGDSSGRGQFALARALIAADRTAEAQRVLDRIASGSGSRQDQAAARSLLAHTHFRMRRPEDGVQSIEQLAMDTETPRVSIPFEAMASLFGYQESSGPLSEEAIFLGYDAETSGNWVGRYGRKFYYLAGMTSPLSLTGGRLSGKVAVKGQTGNPDDTHGVRAWLAAPETTDPRALLNPLRPQGTRTFSCHDDHGEALHPFSEGGPDLFYEVGLPDGHYLLSLYVLDFDWWNFEQPRQQTTLITDPEGRILACALSPGMHRGVYQRFVVSGPRRLTIRLQKHVGICAVLSGLFLDPVPSLADFPRPPKATRRPGDAPDWAAWARKAAPGVYETVDSYCSPGPQPISWRKLPACGGRTVVRPHRKQDACATKNVATDAVVAQQTTSLHFGPASYDLAHHADWIRTGAAALLGKLSPHNDEKISCNQRAVVAWFKMQLHAALGAYTDSIEEADRFVQCFEEATNPDPHRVRTLERLVGILESVLPLEARRRILKRRIPATGFPSAGGSAERVILLARRDLALRRIPMARDGLDAVKPLYQNRPLPWEAQALEFRLLRAERHLDGARRCAESLLDQRLSKRELPPLPGEEEQGPDDQKASHLEIVRLFMEVLSLMASTDTPLAKMEQVLARVEEVCDAKSPFPRLALTKLAQTAVNRRDLGRARRYADRLSQTYGKTREWQIIDKALARAAKAHTPNWKERMGP